MGLPRKCGMFTRGGKVRGFHGDHLITWKSALLMKRHKNRLFFSSKRKIKRKQNIKAELAESNMTQKNTITGRRNDCYVAQRAIIEEV
jgi:hypothetical protein